MQETTQELVENNSSGSHSRTYKIVVNGREKTVENEILTFEQVVALAFDPLPPGPNVAFTVSYRHAREQPAEGTLVAGDSVRIKNGTVFSVTATDKS